MTKFYRFMAAILLAAVCAVCGAEAFEYSSGGRRDPFVPLVGVVSAGVKGGIMSVLNIDDVVFQGIIINSDGSRSAVLNGEIMRQGDKVERVEMVEVGPTYVKIKVSEEDYTIDLYD